LPGKNWCSISLLASNADLKSGDTKGNHIQNQTTRDKIEEPLKSKDLPCVHCDKEIYSLCRLSDRPMNRNDVYLVQRSSNYKKTGDKQ
jgi:hypothetical protein